MESRKRNRKGRGSRAVSPAISTAIITGTIVVLVSVAIAFANNYLWMRIAEGDFNSAKQFMQTIGLEVDDVAWIMGRTETVRYSSRYGEVSYQPSALKYTVYVNGESFADYTVGVLLFNIPVSKYSVNDGYYEPIFPSSTSNLVLSGTSAPVVRVFAVEKLTPPMYDGSYTRIVVAPSVRSLFSNITRESDTTHYVKLYLPVLDQGSSPRKAQSVTLTGSSVTANTINDVTSVEVQVEFPSSDKGFGEDFFRFPENSQEIEIPAGDVVLEVYAGEVTVELGVHI